MTVLRCVAAALLLAAGTAGTAAAAPVNLGNVAPPVAADGEAATPVHHWRRRCWPVHRRVWTHWGWRYRYVGHRCAPRYRYHYRHPHYRYRYR